MVWALLLIAAVFALINYPLFRRMLFAATGVLALVVLGYLAYHRSQAEASKRLVSANELAFEDMRLGPESYGSAYKLAGRVKNNSKYTVYSIHANIRVLDCDDESNCEIVGEEEPDILLMIPPGQVRDIDDSILFGSGTRVRRRFEWSYAIGEIDAGRD